MGIVSQTVRAMLAVKRLKIRRAVTWQYFAEKLTCFLKGLLHCGLRNVTQGNLTVTNNLKSNRMSHDTSFRPIFINAGSIRGFWITFNQTKPATCRLNKIFCKEREETWSLHSKVAVITAVKSWVSIIILSSITRKCFGRVKLLFVCRKSQG